MPEPRLSGARAGSNGTELATIVRETAEAGLSYYGRMAGLAVALAEAVAPSLAELRPRLRRSSEPPPPAAARATAAAPDPQAAQTIVIEAAAGKSGLGVFMVENTTTRQVSGPLGVSPFADEAGREVEPTVRFAPDVVSLDPGDQVLVQVAAVVDESLEPGVRYTGEISIPQLSGMRIPLVVRRRGRPRSKRA